MSNISNGLRVAWRSLVAAPLPNGLAIAALALGVGANSVVFSAVRGVLLSPLPYPEADRIVQVWTTHRASPELFTLLDERLTRVESLDASETVHLFLEKEGDAWEVPAGQVTSAHFDLLGARPAMGRTFTRADEAPGSDAVIVLSHGLWQSRFGGDPGILGRHVRLGDAKSQMRTVVGVMPPSHQPLGPTWQAWIPVSLDPGNRDAWSDDYRLRLHARLRAGATIESATEELRRVASWLKLEFPQMFLRDHEAAALSPLLEVMVGGVRTQLLLLTGAVALVLLVACANVANLLLTRGVARRRELAIRSALGASQGRLVRQLLTESALLGLAGGGLGLILAGPLVTLIDTMPVQIPRLDGVRIDFVVTAYAFLLALASSLLAGLVPAWRVAQGGLRESLEGGGRSGSSGGRQRMHGALVTAEVALAVALVVGAGLLLRSSWRLQRVDPGFKYESVLTLQLSPPPNRYSSAERIRAFSSDLRSRLARVPGVTSSGAASLLPLSGRTVMVGFEIDGQRRPPGERASSADYTAVDGDFLQTLGIPLTGGRWLREADGAPGTAGPVAVLVNRAFAETFFPGEVSVGHRLTWEDDDWMRIVGVVGDTRQHQLETSPRPQIYAPLGGEPAARLEVVVQAKGDPVALIGPIRAAVKSVDKAVPINRIVPMSEVVSGSSARARVFSALLAGLASLALLLGALGIYGVISYGVFERRREISVRMALGARRRTVLREVIQGGLRSVVMGLLAGLILAAFGGRLLSSQLYEVPSYDPPTFGAVTLGVLVVAAMAALAPAFRAAGLDPIAALRED
jgi:putative ABC transport system permease protein